jgi:hypothetical protein
LRGQKNKTATGGDTVIGEIEILEKTIQRAFTGEGAHVEAKNIFDGLDWNVAGVRPDGSPHSVFQILKHMIYWQDWAMRWLDGKKPRVPKGSRKNNITIIRANSPIMIVLTI